MLLEADGEELAPEPEAKLVRVVMLVLLVRLQVLSELHVPINS